MKLFPALLMSFLFVSPVFFKRDAYIHSNDTQSAIEIMNKSESVYAHLQIYIDSGMVVDSFYNTNIPFRSRKFFRTAYSSNGNFNFEYCVLGQKNSLYIMNRAGNSVKTWWGITNKTKTPATLLLALAEGAGVSSKTSSIIPDLLLTNDFSNKVNIYHTVIQPQLEESEIIHGTNCYKIKGTDRQGDITIWIAKSNYLIRKIETDKHLTTAKLAAMMSRTDSLNKTNYVSKYLADPLIKYPAPLQDFHVRSTYLYFASTYGNTNSVLFIFRPNHDVTF